MLTPNGSPAARRILYIDDDAGFGKLATHMLERMGHQVTFFSSPARALDALSAQPEGWDIVITDHRMPGKNGLEVACVVRDRHPRIDYAVVSAYLGAEALKEADAAGLGPILRKPMSSKGFETLLEQLTCRAA